VVAVSFFAVLLANHTIKQSTLAEFKQ